MSCKLRKPEIYTQLLYIKTNSTQDTRNFKRLVDFVILQYSLIYYLNIDDRHNYYVLTLLIECKEQFFLNLRETNK